MISVAPRNNFGPEQFVEIKPTLFPDKTSQVWQLPKELLEAIYKANWCSIRWNFESEAELLHVAQLKTLLDTYAKYIVLDIPYLPYARQDKRVENNSTFALHTFATLINALNFNRVVVLDVHSDRASMIRNLDDTRVKDQIYAAVNAVRMTLVVYPDAGAQARYSGMGFPSTHAEKIRDLLTGRITYINIVGSHSVKDRVVLMVDDLCDGGATFKLLAAQLYKDGAKEVHLYVTHGLFTAGVQGLFDAGIKRIFTYKGEVNAVTAAV